MPLGQADKSHLAPPGQEELAEKSEIEVPRGGKTEPEGEDKGTEKKEEEDVKVPKHGDQMPSFDEWKKKQLADQLSSECIVN